ncbi:hypothetical protein MLD38_033134 [Melastoma candidum]|uniref:Uncharacterized protein n=1 Tax=Melastoma candidum TaxID=119954 RepID=A0ACB9M819_9MYRT|nr:hypothetical protein MLD38_033134 [Melastoma candidum]
MNNDTAYNNDTTSGILGGNNIGGLGYGIGVSVGILLLITTITLASYFCTRSLQQSNGRSMSSSWARRDRISRIRNVMPMPPEDDRPHHLVLAVDPGGLDEATIAGYPKLPYSEAKLSDSTTASCCSICLADYKGGDSIRLLPECGHLFHPKCIDPWLRSHPTCPVCRTSPMPTPLAEVVPLAIRRS